MKKDPYKILIRKIKWQLMREELLAFGRAILEKKEYIDNQNNLKNDVIADDG